jgi:predicted dehydrogenase
MKRKNNKIRCAVVGVGYLGKFHAAKYAFLDEAELVAVCDNDAARSTEIAANYNVEALNDYKALIGKVDAVSIAVPTSLHYEVTKFFLENKIHVLLEKPIATTLLEANALIDLAKKNKVIFQIGHLERFNPVIQHLQPLLNKPVFIEAWRLAPFKPRGTDVDVVLDLMIHDLDLIQSLVPAKVSRVFANGAPVFSDKIDLAHARVEFANGCVANLTASRVSLKTERKMRIFQHDACFSCDFNDKTLAIYRKGKSKVSANLPEIAHEKIVLEQNDALYVEIAAFVEAIATNGKPIVTGEAGRDALATALEITQMATENMQKIMISY